jgi:hypothetical protein
MLFANKVPLGVPVPPAVLPVPPPAPESAGGGGTTLGMPITGAVDDARVPVPPDTPVDGGGAITFAPRDAPMPLRLPRGLPPAALALTVGGGGTTLVGSAVPVLPVVPVALTAGGGGTTSVAPKILPIKLLMKDPLPDCVGGGGTTDFDGSGTLPLARRCKSRATSVEGGGAMTAGAGIASMGSRLVARSGAETGGGTTDTFVICTGALEISRLTVPGVGGITLAASAGVDRATSRVTLGAGATTEAPREGAINAWSRATLGAGGMMAGPSAGATRVWSRETLGAGGTTVALK